MFSDHWVYIGLVLLVALVVFGPKRLPELGQSLGKAITEFRRATQSATDEVRSVGSLVQAPPIPTTPSAAPSTASPAVSSETSTMGPSDTTV